MDRNRSDTLEAWPSYNGIQVHRKRGIAIAGIAVERVRIESIDPLSGIVMILMALDYTRDFLGVPGISPTDLSHATVPCFSHDGSRISAHLFSFSSPEPARGSRCVDSPGTLCRDSSLSRIISSTMDPAPRVWSLRSPFLCGKSSSE